MEQYVQLMAKDVSRRPVKLEPEKTLYDARNIMQAFGISRVVIAKGDKPVGIVTEKDIAKILYLDVLGRHLDQIKLEEVMNKNLVTVNEHSGLNICAKAMDENRISSVISVDSAMKLRGIITKTDLVEVYAKYYAGKHLVQDYMTRKIFIVTPEDTTRTVLSIMTVNKLSRILVVKEQKLVGIITSRDLLPVIGLFAPGTFGTVKMPPRSGEDLGIITPAGVSRLLLAEDIMTGDPVTVTKDSDLSLAAQIMVNKRISGLPVVDMHKNVEGIVTKTDIVRAFTVT
ncbi:MAG: CBS domain-containing protein [Nitrososphaerales archaeon]